VRKSGFLEKYEVYSARYNVSLRTVKRWGTLGAPLDVPEKMAAWWEKNMTQRAPDSILGAAAKEKELPLDSAEVETREIIDVSDEETGVTATQKRMQNAEVILSRAYLDAVKSGDEGKIRAALRNWNDISDQVRTIAKVAREDEIARRDLIPRVEAETQLVEIHTTIFSTIRGLFPTIARLYQIPLTADGEEKWATLCDTFCDTLKTSVFTTATPSPHETE
jgi:hypothetical protein